MFYFRPWSRVPGEGLGGTRQVSPGDGGSRDFRYPGGEYDYQDGGNPYDDYDFQDPLNDIVGHNFLNVRVSSI